MLRSKNHTDVPLLKIESDYTIQSSGQLLTRLEAFAESIQPETLEQTIDGDTKGERKMGKGYFAGIDSGSTSTDVVILNKDHEIVTSIILAYRSRSCYRSRPCPCRGIEGGRIAERRY